MNWNTELTVCFVSTSVVNVAFAASYHLPAAASPPVSCAFLPRKPANGTAQATRYFEIGRHARAREPAAERLHFAEAPHARARFGHHRLARLLRERGEVEVVAAHHVLRDRDAQVCAARALRLQLEAVDAGQIALTDPQGVAGALWVGSNAVERDGPSS
jgi:hypothetical protein